MTKSEMIARVDQITREYLGHPLDGIAPKSWSKERIALRLEASERMIVLHRQAEAIRTKYTETQWTAMCLFHRDIPEMVEHARLCRKASDLWRRPTPVP